jgi:hypothetical protein
MSNVLKARPNLSDEIFRQDISATLTLSGNTNINNVTGFSINDGIKYIPIIYPFRFLYEYFGIVINSQEAKKEKWHKDEEYKETQKARFKQRYDLVNDHDFNQKIKKHIFIKKMKLKNGWNNKD